MKNKCPLPARQQYKQRAFYPDKMQCKQSMQQILAAGTD